MKRTDVTRSLAFFCERQMCLRAWENAQARWRGSLYLESGCPKDPHHACSHRPILFPRIHLSLNIRKNFFPSPVQPPKTIVNLSTLSHANIFVFLLLLEVVYTILFPSIEYAHHCKSGFLRHSAIMCLQECAYLTQLKILRTPRKSAGGKAWKVCGPTIGGWRPFST